MTSSKCLGCLVSLSCVLLVAAASSLAQSRGDMMLPDAGSDSGLGGQNTIEGRVTLSSGQRLERRVRVKLVTMTRGDVTSMTDDHGNFAFRGLVGGDYTVVIDGEQDFKPVSYPVNIIQFRGSPPQSYPVSIRLELKPGSEYAPGVLNTEMAGVSQHARDLYNKATELDKLGDHQGAIDQLKLAVADDPKFMYAFYQIGNEYSQLKEYDKADEAYQAALKLQPDSFPALKNRGIVLVYLNKYAEAETCLRSASKLNGQTAAVHFYLGRAIGSQSQARFDEAEKEFLEAAKLGGADMKEAHRMLAIIYSARGDKKKAADELETYLKLAPDAPDADQLRKVIDQLKAGTTGSPATAEKGKPSL